MNNAPYHFPKADGTTINFYQPLNIVEFDDLTEAGVPPLSLALIVFSHSIELPDGTCRKVFSRWTKDRFRVLQSQYDPQYIKEQCRTLLAEYWAGYNFTNPIGLLIHRITRNATQSSPIL